MPTLVKQAVAEAIGTFALIFIGAGTMMAFSLGHGKAPFDSAAFVGIALAHGLAIAVMVTATGHISGGHLNPAVTLGLFAGGKVKPLQAVVYIIAQLLGACAAAQVLYYASPSRDVLGDLISATPDLARDVTKNQGILIEAVLTFFLVFVVLGSAVDQRTSARIGGLAIGFTIIMDILMGGRLTGASMNPARTFGPAVVTWHWDNHEVYWLGPVLGGVVAGFLYCYFLMDRKDSRS